MRGMPGRMFACGLTLGVIVCVLGLDARSADAQVVATATNTVAGRPAASAVRVEQPPVVDGDVIGDPVWQRAQPASGFVQEQPDEGFPASERTEVRIVFTADTLYLGVVCYDRDPGAIIVSDARRDASLEETDSFRVIFDTYRDGLNGFVFGTNPAGIEYDGQVTNEGQGGGGLGPGRNQQSGAGGGFNLNWDGAWSVRARIMDAGWTAEFAIPFRTLRFDAGEGQVWGVNFQRNIRRRNERSYWAPIPRQYSLYRVSLAGALSGLETPVIQSLKITPYALGSVVASGVRPVDEDFSPDVGLDLKYNPLPSVTIDGTVNTDFAQVEVDEQQVNLDRFNLFFPEKRPFFLENAGYFAVGNPGEVDLFFSRRIGIADDGRSIPILGGGRVTGKIGQYSLGLLNMQTDDIGGELAANNFLVARLSRDLPNRSSIGGLFVSRQGTGNLSDLAGTNRTYALDGKVGLREHTVFSSFVARTSTRELDGDDHAFNLRSRTNVPRFDLEVGYQEVAGNFNPEVGFCRKSGS